MARTTDPLGDDDYRGCLFAGIFCVLVGVLILMSLFPRAW